MSGSEHSSSIETDLESGSSSGSDSGSSSETPRATCMGSKLYAISIIQRLPVNLGKAITN